MNFDESFRKAVTLLTKNRTNSEGKRSIIIFSYTKQTHMISIESYTLEEVCLWKKWHKCINDNNNPAEIEEFLNDHYCYDYKLFWLCPRWFVMQFIYVLSLVCFVFRYRKSCEKMEVMWSLYTHTRALSSKWCKKKCKRYKQNRH